MKFSELKNLSKAELENLLNQNQEKLKDLRFNLAFGKVKDISEFRKVKKNIAQIKTLLNNQKNEQAK
ncbi:MAG TPA: 50S ribosomal protein L29 [Candidatus Paceibacterota bacterium]|jgi:ribosomal protein L29|nr:50S ribosomal protein L29 [Parcubacteria group bacterium]HOM33117.1 50S ribosomal protein L29 [Candidatus Paceibacterota bacterium]HPC37350.1 50S ribosomal protein L29 [Candidatus Paceibacterota bacterium]HRU35824.1 50S ribosomal protein L29 [Candidatus Paceibacterota bacterium]